MGCTENLYGLSIIQGIYHSVKPVSWSKMSRVKRKSFHRENSARLRKGLSPKSKPL